MASFGSVETQIEPNFRTPVCKSLHLVVTILQKSRNRRCHSFQHEKLTGWKDLCTRASWKCTRFTILLFYLPMATQILKKFFIPEVRGSLLWEDFQVLWIKIWGSSFSEGCWNAFCSLKSPFLPQSCKRIPFACHYTNCILIIQITWNSAHILDPN